MSNYVVALAAESDARFREEPVPFRVEGLGTPVGTVELTFRTRYADEGLEAAVPREMWIDARGRAEEPVSLPDVITAYANAAAGILPFVAMSTNVWVGDIEPKIAYDATPGLTKRDYFTSFVREERGTVPPSRRIVDAPATVTLLRAIA